MGPLLGPTDRLEGQSSMEHPSLSSSAGHRPSLHLKVSLDVSVLSDEAFWKLAHFFRHRESLVLSLWLRFIFLACHKVVEVDQSSALRMFACLNFASCRFNLFSFIIVVLVTLISDLALHKETTYVLEQYLMTWRRHCTH